MSAHLAYPSLANAPLADVLRLIRTLNVGPVTFFHLIARFGTPAAALERLPELSLKGGRRNALEPCPKDAVFKEIDAVHNFGARMIKYGDADYPALLHSINDAPPVITVMGHTHLWQQKMCVAVVGSRNASANGCAFAQKLAKDLGEAGLVVVSGLARGIDSFAHKGSLATGTVGVIAGGIDNIYPPENEMLTHSIREAGCVISEQPFGGLPYSSAFPGRNRIIAGMSAGTLIVEASPKSGSLITAKYALDYNREVFAVPGSPLDPRAKGCNGLIKDGAHIVESAQDVLAGLAHLKNQRFEEPKDKPFASAGFGARDISEGEMGEVRNAVLAKLGHTAVPVDTLLAQTGVPGGALLTILLELELAGKLVRMPGNKVCLTMEESLRMAGNE